MYIRHRCAIITFIKLRNQNSYLRTRYFNMDNFVYLMQWNESIKHDIYQPKWTCMQFMYELCNCFEYNKNNELVSDKFVVTRYATCNNISHLQ